MNNTYYFYIDESGSFEKEKSNHSFVGGFITQTKPEQLYQNIEQAIKSFQAKHGQILGLKDIHAAELLHADTFPDKGNKAKYEKIHYHIRKKFIDLFAQIVNQQALYFIKSENKQFQFGEENEQSRYGNCLGAWFQQAIDDLVQKEQNKKFELIFAIAPRSRKCLPKEIDWKSYHSNLDQYIRTLCNATDHISKAQNLSNSNIKNLLDLADVACDMMRQKTGITIKDKNKLKITKPNKVGKTYQDFHQESQQDLIHKGEIAAAYRLAQNKKEQQDIFEKLHKIDVKQQPTQIRYFLNIAYELVDNRTLQTDALMKAKGIFQNILDTFEDSQNEKIQELIKDTINGLILCSNHSGEIIGQTSLLEKTKAIINTQKTLPAFTRYIQTLEGRNRVFNDQFNNYRFDEIINCFEKEVEKYEKVAHFAKEQRLLPESEKDYLLHKLLGTLGQAYAFLSAQDEDYLSEAKKYFEKSLQYFDESLKDLRTPIYLATLYWYHKQFDQAEQVLKDYKIILPANNLVTSLLTHLDNQHDKNTAFIVSILLHLAIDQEILDKQSIKKIASKCEQLEKTHPMELIYKWIGIAYLQLKNRSKATQYFQKAIKIQQGFTIKTINLSTYALKIIAHQQSNHNTTKESENFEKSLNELIKESQGFKLYLDEIGGKAKWLQDIEEQNIPNIIRWLPFSYS